MIAGTMAAGGAAFAVSRSGLGNGFAVLFAVEALGRIFDAAIRAAAGPSRPWTEMGALLVLAAVLLPIVLAFRPRPVGPRVLEPTCGLFPVLAPWYVLTFPLKVAAWIPAVVPLVDWMDRAPPGAAALLWISISAVVAVALAQALYPPRDVVAAFGRAAPTAGDVDAAAVRRALRWANVRSVAYVVAVAAFPSVAAAAGVPFTIHPDDLVAAFILVAVLLDVRDELIVRSRGAPLASAWGAHRVYAVAPALAALERAGIPAHARSRRYRALFQIFAPYAPIEILVPADRVAEATPVCARILGPPAP